MADIRTDVPVEQVQDQPDQRSPDADKNDHTNRGEIRNSQPAFFKTTQIDLHRCRKENEGEQQIEYDLTEVVMLLGVGCDVELADIGPVDHQGNPGEYKSRQHRANGPRQMNKTFVGPGSHRGQDQDKCCRGFQGEECGFSLRHDRYLSAEPILPATRVLTRGGRQGFVLLP